MLFEFSLAGLVLYFGGASGSVRHAARLSGRALGRAAGSLRRVRAEVDRVHARAEALGGRALHDSRVDIAARVSRLRAIQAEAAAALGVGGGSGFAIVRPTPAFSDDEISAALRAEASSKKSS